MDKPRCPSCKSATNTYWIGDQKKKHPDGTTRVTSRWGCVKCKMAFNTYGIIRPPERR